MHTAVLPVPVGEHSRSIRKLDSRSECIEAVVFAAPRPAGVVVSTVAARAQSSTSIPATASCIGNIDARLPLAVTNTGGKRCKWCGSTRFKYSAEPLCATTLNPSAASEAARPAASLARTLLGRSGALAAPFAWSRTHRAAASINE